MFCISNNLLHISVKSDISLSGRKGEYLHKTSKFESHTHPLALLGSTGTSLSRFPSRSQTIRENEDTKKEEEEEERI